MSDLKDTRDNINEMIENIKRDNPIFAANIGAAMNALYDEIEQLQALGVAHITILDRQKKEIEQLQADKDEFYRVINRIYQLTEEGSQVFSIDRRSNVAAICAGYLTPPEDRP